MEKNIKHKNLSIFVPHEGCPNQCSFCDQREISGTQAPPTASQVTALCDKFLPQDSRRGAYYEIAFFGGSFTAIDRGYMLALLQAAYPFVQAGRRSGIRVSTRPDAIDDEILSILKAYGVTAIELGAQSMQDDVLAANLRGHTVADVYTRSRLIKKWGFSLGLQMMTGLYRQTDYLLAALDTANQFVNIGPDTVRIYPTLTLKNTLLRLLYQKGDYIPPTLQQSVEICRQVLKIFEREGIKVIKLGLHADTGLEDSLVAGPYHPAFRELVLSEVFMDNVLAPLEKAGRGVYEIKVSPRKLSQALGQKKANIGRLADKGYTVTITADNSLSDDEITINKKGDRQCI